MAQRKKNNPLPKGPYYFKQGTLGQVDRSLLPLDTIDNIEEFDITSPGTGSYLRFNGTSWIDVTISQILTDLKTADGVGSGLDADTLDTFHASSFARLSQDETVTGQWTFTDDPTVSNGAYTGYFNFESANESADHNAVFVLYDSGDLPIWRFYKRTDKNLALMRGSTPTMVWEADVDTGVVDFNETPTKDGVALALSTDAPVAHTHTESEITDGKYRLVARDGFVAVTARETLRLIGGNNITLSNADDPGNDETEITISAGDLAIGDLTNVYTASPQDWNLLRYNSAQARWEQAAVSTLLTQLEAEGIDAETVGGELPSAFADASHTHVQADITDFPTIYFQYVARNGFTAVPQRSLLRLIAGTGIEITHVDDSGNDESEFTFTRSDMILDDLTDVEDGGTAVDWNMLRWNDSLSRWERAAIGTLLTQLEGLGIDAASIQGDDIYASIAPSDGDVLTWDNANSRWDAVAPASAPTLYYQQVARDGFTAMTQRNLLRLIGGTGISISNADDAGNNETEITFTRDDMDLDDLSNVSDPGGAQDWNMLRYYNAGGYWQRASLADVFAQMQADEKAAALDTAQSWTAAQTFANVLVGFEGDLTTSVVWDVKVDSDANSRLTCDALGVLRWYDGAGGEYAELEGASDGLTLNDAPFIIESDDDEKLVLRETGSDQPNGLAFYEDTTKEFSIEQSGAGRIVVINNNAGGWIRLKTSGGSKIQIDDGSTNNARIAGVKDITATATAPSGDYPYGTLHLIY